MFPKSRRPHDSLLDSEGPMPIVALLLDDLVPQDVYYRNSHPLDLLQLLRRLAWDGREKRLHPEGTSENFAPGKACKTIYVGKKSNGSYLKSPAVHSCRPSVLDRCHNIDRFIVIGSLFPNSYHTTFFAFSLAFLLWSVGN